MLKKWPRGFIYVDRAQTEQQLNLVHDRGIYFTFFYLWRLFRFLPLPTTSESVIAKCLQCCNIVINGLANFIYVLVKTLSLPTIFLRSPRQIWSCLSVTLNRTSRKQKELCVLYNQNSNKKTVLKFVRWNWCCWGRQAELALVLLSRVWNKVITSRLSWGILTNSPGNMTTWRYAPALFFFFFFFFAGVDLKTCMHLKPVLNSGNRHGLECMVKQEEVVTLQGGLHAMGGPTCKRYAPSLDNIQDNIGLMFWRRGSLPVWWIARVFFLFPLKLTKIGVAWLSLVLMLHAEHTIGYRWVTLYPNMVNSKLGLIWSLQNHIRSHFSLFTRFEYSVNSNKFWC